MSNRDEFSPTVKRAVAARAGWHCSFTGCTKLTVGPSEESATASTCIGQAAHICAAASGPGARRFDPAMTPEERAGIDNAIWLCSDHAVLIDRDEVTYTADILRVMKLEHEAACARALRTGSSAELVAGMLAIGPNIVCTGDVLCVDANSWTIGLQHFLIGDLHRVISFVNQFENEPANHRYILSNELGDGRLLLAAPRLAKRTDGIGYSLYCSIAPSFERIDARELGADFALHPETNDPYADKQHNITLVAGIDRLPQLVCQVLSMQLGESPFHPTFGARLFEYFENYHDSPWLDLFLKLEVIRQASIPYDDAVLNKRYTPLQCITRVHAFELLSHTATKSRIPVRVTLDVQGMGQWQRELLIYMPTPEQVAQIEKRRSEWHALLRGLPPQSR